MFAETYLVVDPARCSGDSPTGNALFEIRTAVSDRQWLEVHYVVDGIEPISGSTIVPARPDDPEALLDACILFYPDYFRDCPSMPAVMEALRGPTRIQPLDFDLENVPKVWFTLREEARERAQGLRFFELRPVTIGV